MRIVHATGNICGLPMLLVGHQRRLGHQATAVLYPTLAGAAPGSVDLARLLAGNRVTRKLNRARVIAHVAANYDVFHFHYSSFVRTYADVRLLKSLGKTIIFHVHGCDIRDPVRVRATAAISACAECPIECLTPGKLALPGILARYVDRVIVSTPDLLDFVPDAEYIPNPVDASAWTVARPADAARQVRPDGWVVAHAPSNRDIKGTRHIEAAVAALQAEGLPVRLKLLEGLSHDDLRRECSEADVVVDQVLVGWYGVFTLEMLAMGKPVVVYLRPDLRQAARDVPVATADPTTLRDVLCDLLLSPARRLELASRGPAYVGAQHDPLVFTQRILQVYADCRAA
jgi:glycosyltransferase involved in cell wall biosynthesis